MHFDECWNKEYFDNFYTTKILTTTKVCWEMERWGIKIKYEIQPKPEGIAQALLIGDDFINNHPSVLILGDNFFYGSGLEQTLIKVNEIKEGAHVFAYSVKDPERYGVVEFDEDEKVLSIEEKPKKPKKSNYAVTGLYFYDSNAPTYAKSLQPSKRGELEITDLNNFYINNDSMKVEKLDSGHAWFDMGTHDSLLDASIFVKSLEKRQGSKIACPEEISFKKNFITAEQLKNLIDDFNGSLYGRIFKKIFCDFMECIDTKIKEVKLIKPKIHRDSRGFFRNLSKKSF